MSHRYSIYRSDDRPRRFIGSTDDREEAYPDDPRRNSLHARFEVYDNQKLRWEYAAQQQDGQLTEEFPNAPTRDVLRMMTEAHLDGCHDESPRDCPECEALGRRP